ncbi:MAG TPA: putative Ig domain-containing protein, partial [Gemmataceae bacterium]|nr:putative Ig domain-containing protein [Gemmataceae bacterium]
NPGAYTISLNLTDSDGDSASLMETAYVDSATQQGPTITNPGTQSNVEGDAVSLQLQSTGGPLVFGAYGLPPGLAIDSSSGLISGTIGYTDAETQGGNYWLTVSAYNSAGAYTDQIFQWNVSHTASTPVLQCPDDQTNVEGDGVSLQLTASNADGDPLSYSASGLPDGLTVNPTTGLISGVIAADAGGNHAVTVTAAADTLSDSQSFTWDVSHVFITPLPDQSNIDGDAIAVPVSAWTESGQSLSYGATGLPPGVSINSTSGVISGSIGATDSSSGPYAVTITASDATDSASTSLTWNVSHLSVTNPGDQINAEGDAVSLQVNAADNAADMLLFSAAGLPNGLSIDPNSGLITGIAAAGDAMNGPYNVTVSAAGGGGADSQSFTWTITYITFTDPGPQINAPGDAVNLSIQANDPGGHSLTFSATGLPPGLSINSNTGAITGTISSTAGSDTPYSAVVSAADGTETATLPITWLVTNGNVSMTNPGGQTNAEGANVSLQLNANDPGGQPLTWSAVGLPIGLNIDPDSGLISGSVDPAAAETSGGVYPVTIATDDGMGSNGSVRITWTITAANQAPVLYNPGDQVNLAGDVVSLPLSAYDPDGDTLTFSAAGLPSGLSIDPNSGIISGTIGSPLGLNYYTTTVTASDGSLTASQSFNWFIVGSYLTIDNPGDQTNSEGDTVSLPIEAAFPGGVGSFVASGLPTGLSMNDSTGVISGTISYTAAEDAPGGMYNAIVVAEDSYGDSASIQFGWTVNDVTRPPTLTNPGAQTTAEGNSVSLQIQASSPDGANLTYYASGLPAGLGIDPDTGLISGTIAYGAAASGGGQYATAVTVQDDAGNVVSGQFSWTVTPATPPPWIITPTPPQHVLGDAVNYQVQAGAPDGETLTYSASGLPVGLEINPTSGLITGYLTQTGAYNVTVSASDNGGTAQATFAWNVSAQGPEVIISISNLILLNAGPVPATVTLQDASPGLHYVELDLPGASAQRAALSPPGVQGDSGNSPEVGFWLADGGSASVLVTPLQSSLVQQDTELVAFVDPPPGVQPLAAGDATFTIDKLTFASTDKTGFFHVKAGDTPNGMADRIPPRKVTEEKFSLSVALQGNQAIVLAIEGNSTENGSASISTSDDPNATDKRAQSFSWAKLGDKDGVALVVGLDPDPKKGAMQTQPGHAGNLYLVAYAAGNAANKLKSNGFSVAAIPIGVEMAQGKKLQGDDTADPGAKFYDPSWGAWYKTVEYTSDSGLVIDLDKVQISEQVLPQPMGTGAAKAYFGKPTTSGYKNAIKDADDVNAIYVDVQKVVNGQQVSLASARQQALDAILAAINQPGMEGGAGSQNLLQFFTFKDMRTDGPNPMSEYDVAHSGFSMAVKIEKKPDGTWHMLFNKQPQANNGTTEGTIPDGTRQYDIDFK